MFIRFDINGASVIFEDEFLKYNEIRKNFLELSTKVDAEIRKSVENSKDDSKYDFDFYMDLANKYIENWVKKSIEIMVSFGIVTIDRQSFVNDYYSEHINYKSEVSTLIKTISKQSKKANSYWKSEDLDKFIDMFISYTSRACLNTHYTVVDTLIKNGVDVVAHYPTPDDITKSNALFNNYKDGFIPKPDECEVVKKIIALNPYREEVYKYLIKEDGDFNDEINRLSKFLGYDIGDYKKELFDEYVDEIMNDFDDCDIDIFKEKLNKYCLYIGIELDDKYIDKILNMKRNIIDSY